MRTRENKGGLYGHNLFCDTCNACAAQTRVVTPPQPRSTPLKRCSTPLKTPQKPKTKSVAVQL